MSYIGRGREEGGREGRNKVYMTVSCISWEKEEGGKGGREGGKGV